MQASCQCGNLTAEIQDGAEPVVVACHCRDCQKRSGTGSRGSLIVPTVTPTAPGNPLVLP